jgi:hypothetical protein
MRSRLKLAALFGPLKVAVNFFSPQPTKRPAFFFLQLSPRTRRNNVLFHELIPTRRRRPAGLRALVDLDIHWKIKRVHYLCSWGRSITERRTGSLTT